MNNKRVSNAVIMNELKNVKEKVNTINIKLDRDYVTQAELKLRDQKIELLQKIVYGVVGLILTSVTVAVISLVVKK